MIAGKNFKKMIKLLNARPQVLIVFAGMLTLVWVSLLIWLPLRLLQLL
jgi:hypothetical protein